MGQEIADADGPRIRVLAGGDMRTGSGGRGRRCARRQQRSIELTVGEMADVRDPAVAPDDDVRGRNPEVKRGSQVSGPPPFSVYWSV